MHSFQSQFSTNRRLDSSAHYQAPDYSHILNHWNSRSGTNDPLGPRLQTAFFLIPSFSVYPSQPQQLSILNYQQLRGLREVSRCHVPIGFISMHAGNIRDSARMQFPLMLIFLCGLCERGRTGYRHLRGNVECGSAACCGCRCRPAVGHETAALWN